MKKIFIIIFTFIILSGSFGCKDFFDINKNPDALEEAPIELVLPAALSAPMYVFGGDGQIIGSFFAQHWTQSTGGPQYKAFDSWQLTNETFDGRGYGALYYYALADLKYIREIAEETENWTYFLITNIVEAYVFQMLVDLYDKVPYFEAVQGQEGIITPQFDDGQAIYDALIEKIDNALSKDLNAATCEDPEDADIIFGGNMENWVRFANTLKLKIFLRQSFVNDVSAQIDAMEGEPFLNSHASFDIFVDQGNKRNPIYSTVVVEQPGNITMSRTIMNLLVDNLHGNQGGSIEHDVLDKRVEVIAHKPALVTEFFRALLQGDYQNDKTWGINMDSLENPGAPSVQYLSTPILYYNTPMYYMTEAESYFLQAEAYERFWGGLNSGQEMYENGVIADFTRLGYVGYSADSTEILGQGGNYAQWALDETVADHCELIWTQKWISMVNIQGMEAWIEHNRTDTPKEYPYHPTDYSNYSDWMEASGDPQTYYKNGWFTIAINNVTSNRFPRRLLCPQSELDGNPNVPDDMRNAQIYDEVWWDVVPQF
jgi:hypothetical protein